MEETQLNLNEIIKVEQLPKIVETLGIISESIDKEIKKALALDCTDESKNEVKKSRANLNKIKSVLEERRKFVKEQILLPYKEFEDVYNELVKEKLENADKTLKERIETIEITQREQKIQELISFAKEWLAYYQLDGLIQAKQVMPSVTLTKSQKSLKEQIKGQIDRIAEDMKIMKLEEYGEDMLPYYLTNGFDYTKAKLQVVEHNAKKQEASAMLFTRDSEEEQWKPITNEITPPKEEIIEPPKEIVEEELESRQECTFTVWAYKDELIKIRNFLKELGVKYE